jgi:hypothetical protein
MPLPAARRLLGRKVARRMNIPAGSTMLLPELGINVSAPPGYKTTIHFPGDNTTVTIGGDDPHAEPAVDRLLLGCVSAFVLDLVYCCLTARSVLSGALVWLGQLASFVLSVYR